MDPSAISLIQKRYASHDHYYYPEMEKMLGDLMTNPEAKVDIPDDFISKTLDNTNILFKIVRKIKIIFWKVIDNAKYYLLPGYSTKFNLAVCKIEEAYRKKTEEISQLAGKLKFCRESFESAKQETAKIEGNVSVLKEVQDNLAEKIAAKTLAKNVFERLLADEVLDLMKLQVNTNQKEIDKEQYKLDVQKGILGNASKNLSDTIQEVTNGRLENFFTSKELAAPENTASDLVPELKKIQDDIEKYSSEDLSFLFVTLLKQLPEIESWTCDANGEFALKLREPYYLWTPERDPAGGAIFMFGSGKDGLITGKLEKNGMTFDAIQTFVNELGGIASSFNRVEYVSRTEIIFHGSYGIFKGSKSKTFTSVRKDWQSGELMDSYSLEAFKKRVSS